eukprot:Skav230247  [mRNA]  locus=scaffold1266:12488:17642:+ [translate_table: standard]
MPPKVRRPAAAIPPRPGRLRRPAAAGVPPREEEDPVKQFKEKHFVEAFKLPVQCLAEGVSVIAEGKYWGAECKVAGRITGLNVKGEGDVEVQMVPEGTNNEDLLTWVGRNKGTSIRLHLCGPHCPRPTDSHGFVHGHRLRMKSDEDQGTWTDNLMETPDELARLRDLAEAEARKEEESSEAESAGGTKKKKKKDKKKGKSEKKEKGGEEEKKRKNSKRFKMEPQKTLVACYQNTGMDPDPKVRRKARKKLRKYLKKKKDTSTSSSSSQNSKSGSDGSSGEDSVRSEGVFQDSHRVRVMAQKAPGVLTTATIREIQTQLLTSTGNVWSVEKGELPAVCLQYFRQQLQGRMSGGAAREALTLSWCLDLLLQGRLPECADTLCQRLKALELISAGTAWSVAQRVEVVPQERGQLSSRAETQVALKESHLDNKTKTQAKGKEKGNRYENSYSAWKGNTKGDSKDRGKGKSKKGEKEEGKNLGFEVQGKAKPKGDVFPLPCSTDFLGETVGDVGDVSLLRCLCLALNSYAGVALEGPPKGSPSQCDLIRGLAEDVDSVCKWTERFEDLTWQSFFRMRSVDYLGDEVATAKHTSWENLAPAIPSQVGTVELSQLLEGGCKHYVDCFEEYLLEEADRWYVRPPRVMIPDEHWEAVCEGLLKAGICTVLHEDQLFKVEDRPLLNGLFGVEKGEQVGGYDVHRLIMNLIPLNGICRGIQGDVATLPSWASAGPLQLMPTEQLLISSEDVRCFFYIFRVPTAWHKFLGFNKPVPQKFCGDKDGKHYLCATVLPMGFKNSVALAQAVHRSVVVKASSRLDGHLSGEQEIRKDKPFPRNTRMHRIYLDNFDELQKCDVAMASLVKGSPSPAVLALRAEYEHWGIPRHPGKAVERGEVAEVQGAVVDGVQGHCGRSVYICTFRRAILGSMNYVWSFIESFTGYPPFIKLEIPALVKLEVARCIALMPLAKLQFRNKIDPLVTASDASTTGGGVTASLGLTNLGQIAASTKIRGDLPEPAHVTQVLTIGLFDGIGALRVAADSLQLPIAGHISVEKEASASRVLESRFPGTIFVTDVAEVDKAMVQSWACQFSQVGLIVLGAGPPCQGVSGLNANRRGALKDHRSCLFLHVSRIRLLVQEVFVWAQVHLLGESVQSMDQKDRTVMSESFELLPWAIDAADVSLAHRPRLYWISWELQPGKDVLIHPPAGSSSSTFGQVKLSCTIETKRYLTPGWQKCSDTTFPTFTTARPRSTPGRRPAGLDKLNASERAQWVADDFRFPPYQYQLCHQVYRGQEHRLPSSDEREVMMGLPKGYTYHCLPKSRQGTQEHTDLRNSLVGNSWNVTVVCWLLSQLAAPLGLCEALSPQQCVDITAPGCTQTLASFLGRPPMYSSKKQIKGGNEKQLVSMLVNQVSIKGEDILLSAQTEDTLKYHRLRASLPSTLWSWRTICGWQWRGSKEHINVLELRAVLCALRWRICKQRIRNHKFIHMIDSLVCLHSLTRGRTSSRKMRRTLCKINALLLLSRNSGVWAYVHTSSNPADAPSRRGVRRKWAKK